MTWDSAKARENFERHGVTFADVLVATEDADRIEIVDDRFAYGEERISIIGWRSAKSCLSPSRCPVKTPVA